MTGGTSTFTAAHDFKLAFFTKAQELYAAGEGTAQVQVVFGRPASFLQSDVVAFGRVGAPQDVATLGTNRSRDEVLELEVHVSSFVRVGEADDPEIAASARAYTLLGVLEHFARVTDTTIDGTVRSCFLAKHDSEGMTPIKVIPQGRNVTVTAVFRAENRITS